VRADVVYALYILISGIAVLVLIETLHLAKLDFSAPQSSKRVRMEKDK
jgi:hypothetical protein